MKKTIIIIFLLIFCASKSWAAAVVSANAASTKVGSQILKTGGNALDAAIAMAFSLAVVEPYHSGLGGGGFMLIYVAKDQKWFFVDYREQSPQNTQKDLYLKNPKAKDDGIYSIGIPGFVAGLYQAHQKWGQKDWAELLQPAVNQAHEGFKPQGIYINKVTEYANYLNQNTAAKKIFLEPVSSSKKRIYQKDLATTIASIAQKGEDVFYKGNIAKQIVSSLNNQGSKITLNDLKNYRVRFLEPYTFTLGDYHFYTAPLPSSGGIGLKKMFDQKLAQQKNKQNNPVEIFRDYFDYRDKSLGDFLGHTTHLNVIDDQGNMVAMTNTINDNFGSKIIAAGTGVLMNNELGDFSLDSTSKNFIKPNKRPLSSMAPTIILKNKKPFLLIGTPGGRSIPQNIFQVLDSYLFGGSSLKAAIKSKKIYWLADKQKAMIEKGYSKKTKGAFYEEKKSVGNVQAILVQPKLKAFSDPRGEGLGLVTQPLKN